TPSAHLMSTSVDIDRFAKFHAKCLVEESDWRPSGTDSAALLEGLASRIGHFTNGDDALLAWDFSDELDGLLARSKAALLPDGHVWYEVGHHCHETGCAGRMKVRVNRDNGFNP